MAAHASGLVPSSSHTRVRAVPLKLIPRSIARGCFGERSLTETRCCSDAQTVGLRVFSLSVFGAPVSANGRRGGVDGNLPKKGNSVSWFKLVISGLADTASHSLPLGFFWGQCPWAPRRGAMALVGGPRGPAGLCQAPPRLPPTPCTALPGGVARSHPWGPCAGTCR